MNKVDVMLPQEVFRVEISCCHSRVPKGHGNYADHRLLCLEQSHVQQVFVSHEKVKLLVDQVVLHATLNHPTCQSQQGDQP